MITKGWDGFHVYAAQQYAGGPFTSRDDAQAFTSSDRYKRLLKRIREEEEEMDSRVVWMGAGGGGSIVTEPVPESGSGFIDPETGNQFIDPQTGNSFISS